MNIFKAYLKQKGQGCDYTIGCGLTIFDIEANSFEEAREQLIEIVKEGYSSEEDEFEIAELFQIERMLNLDLKEIYAELNENIVLERQKATEEREKQEFERLKQKFNK